MSSTALFAQHGKQNPDTIKCYGLSELRYIALSLLEGRACDTLLSNANAKILNREKLLAEKVFEIEKLNQQSELKEKIIKTKNDEISAINLQLEDEQKSHRLTKAGWLCSSILLGAGLIYFMIQ